MLIIFDLDDTLIDTSGAVTPFKMKLCLERLRDMGLQVGPFLKAFKELMEINQVSYRSIDTLKRFVESKGGDPAAVNQIVPELTSPLPDDFTIPTTPHAKEILEELSSRHRLALVTGGHPPFQREKLKKAGIEPSVFSNILIPEDSNKKPAYEALRKEFSVLSSCRSFRAGQAGCNHLRDVIVCGDRIPMDLAPAYELGFTTVHMRWGRGLVNQTEPWIDFAIADLSELRKIVR